jgi:hypothetical protein
MLSMLSPDFSVPGQVDPASAAGLPLELPELPELELALELEPELEPVPDELPELDVDPAPELPEPELGPCPPLDPELDRDPELELEAAESEPPSSEPPVLSDEAPHAPSVLTTAPNSKKEYSLMRAPSFLGNQRPARVWADDMARGRSTRCCASLSAGGGWMDDGPWHSLHATTRRYRSNKVIGRPFFDRTRAQAA